MLEPLDPGLNQGVGAESCAVRDQVVDRGSQIPTADERPRVGSEHRVLLINRPGSTHHVLDDVREVIANSRGIVRNELIPVTLHLHPLGGECMQHHVPAVVPLVQKASVQGCHIPGLHNVF